MKLIRSRAFAAAVAVIGIAGCATPKQVAKEIVNSNRAQELAENQLLLLNILRAMHREPMHFTLVTSVHMPVGAGTPTLGLSLPIPGGSAANPITATTGTTISQSVDITALNTQEFMRGIMQPMPLDTMIYYIDPGWPREMILTLFVRTIDVPGGVRTADRTVHSTAAERTANAASNAALPKVRYESYPGNPGHFDQFKEIIRHLAACDMNVDPDDPKHFGPELDEKELTTVKALGQMRVASMVFAASSPQGKYQLATPLKSSHLTLGKLASFDEADSTAEPVCPWEGESAGPAPADRKLDAAASTPGRNVPAAATQVKPALVMSLRSPEAMIYFLGEIAREELEPGTTAADLTFQYARNDPKRAGSKTRYPIFSVTHDAGPEICYTEVDFEGQHYCVPKYAYDDRSTQMLSLVHQLITMQNKGTDLPTTSTVRVVP